MRFMTLVLAIGALLCGSGPAFGADGGRGKALYEARCDLCHRSSVHAREARVATSFGALRAQVERWNAELGGAWSRDDIDDVTLYLNNRYYFFPCPESACRSGQAKVEMRRATALSGN